MEVGMISPPPPAPPPPSPYPTLPRSTFPLPPFLPGCLVRTSGLFSPGSWFSPPDLPLIVFLDDVGDFFGNGGTGDVCAVR